MNLPIPDFRKTALRPGARVPRTLRRAEMIVEALLADIPKDVALAAGPYAYPDKVGSENVRPMIPGGRGLGQMLLGESAA